MTACGMAVALVGVLTACGTPGASADAGTGTVPGCRTTSCRLTDAVNGLVATDGGPPGIIVVVQHGTATRTVTAGVADLATGAPMEDTDAMRLASVAKAFSGAAALALVGQGRLSLDDTVGKWLPTLPSTWSGITLRQLLDHTSRIPDFSRQKAFAQALTSSLQQAPPPAQLLTSVEGLPLLAPEGNDYNYSNSDNIIVALMVQAAAGEPYETVLQDDVYGPLGLTGTSLPSGSALPSPYIHGYDIEPPEPEDVSTVFAAGWTWASGGVVSTPLDASTFVRGYIGGKLFDTATHDAQFHFIAGSSEPPGPGTNAVGLGVFRYTTSCGTVYGHTGNTAGYTQFVASTADGSRSVTVSVNAQITPTVNSDLFGQLRDIDLLGVCDALGR
jgi:D-alanyl-D-alanine carboxypeptidase